MGTRVIGIDLGERRIGVAVSDSRRVLASPHSVIKRSGAQSADHRAIAALVSEFDADLVVVGLPLSLSGQLGPAARAAAAEASVLEAQLEVPVVLHDERLTTVEADRLLRFASDPALGNTERGRLGPRQARGSRSGAASRNRMGIDALAATVLLQSWLDHKRAES
ncbi:MAG: Holliday junction resolvase RuvX [Acidimicrobiales bacterium]